MNRTDLPNWRLIVFYAGIPLFVAVYGALNNYGIQQIAGYTGAIGFYLAHSFIPWWITCLSTTFLMWALDRVKPPPLVLMVPGSIIGCVLTLPYTRWITEIFENTWPTASTTIQGIPLTPWSGDFVEYAIRATVVWVVINLIFDRFIGLPRYRYEIPKGYEAQHTQEADSEESTVPAFLTRLPARVSPHEILWIKAEQHYIRIGTENKEHMILYRFSDAVSQLDTDMGMQVHRSWWVAHAAIEGMQQAGKKFLLQLSSGDEVPVSIPYQGAMKELARSKGIPVRPQPAA